MINLRAKVKQRRYRSAVAVVLVVLGLLVVWEHSGVEHGHVDEVVSMCMAVISGVAAVLGLGSLTERPTWSRAVRAARPRSVRPPRSPVPRARAGPTALQVLLR